MYFDWENISWYPQLWIDGLIYLGLFVIVIILCKLLWNWKESRRLKKVYAAYQQRRKDEEQGEP